MADGPTARAAPDPININLDPGSLVEAGKEIAVAEEILAGLLG